MMCNAAHGSEPLVLSAATIDPYATYVACCNYAFNLESIFDSHHAKLNETMGLVPGKQFPQQSTACL